MTGTPTADHARDWSGYDVIGDVHGHADKLEQLLRQLGYNEKPQPQHPRGQSLWSHPDRQAIFIGDLIDRGPAQIRTVDLARAMVEAGTAQMVLGNHEFNAIAFATPNPEVPGEYLRPRFGKIGERNRHQHRKFLGQVGLDSELYREYIAWFRSLPLWLGLPGGLRIVHACWDPESMHVVQRLLSADGSVTYSLMVESSRKGSAEYEAIEKILKGPEIALPDSHHYHDKDGHIRSRARLRWWDPHVETLGDAAEIPADATDRNHVPLTLPPEGPLGAGTHDPYTDDVPVLFGHYWRTEHSVICTPTTACVDFSAGNGGSLVAYRWSGGLLDPDNFVSSQALGALPTLALV